MHFLGHFSGEIHSIIRHDFNAFPPTFSSPDLHSMSSAQFYSIWFISPSAHFRLFIICLYRCFPLVFLSLLSFLLFFTILYGFFYFYCALQIRFAYLILKNRSIFVARLCVKTQLAWQENFNKHFKSPLIEMNWSDWR